jgi:uncharacterized protein YodC (DUF2158 family)
MSNFNIGDVVVLKSGGPKMTVDRVEGGNMVCVWFDGNATKYGTFSSSALKVYDPPQNQPSSSRGGGSPWS